MDIYRLIREKDGCCESVFARNTKMTGCLEGDLYNVSSWSDGEPSDLEYVSSVYIKRDACSHFWFKGEDYDPGVNENIDSYYHICGAYSYKNFMRAMGFAYKLLTELVDSYDKEEFDEIMEVNSKLLEGYKIEKVPGMEYFELKELTKNDKEEK